MSHLSRDERLLALDGALDAARHTHLLECAACRAEVDGLRHVVDRVRAVEVPEPSPLFWDHLAARVGDAIAREPVPSEARGWWQPRLAWVAAAVLTTAATAGYLTRPAPTTPNAAVGTSTAAAGPHPTPPASATGEDDPSGELDASAADDGWALLAAVADETGPSDLFVPAAGEIERSLSSLSADERAALARELIAALDPDRVREG